MCASWAGRQAHGSTDSGATLSPVTGSDFISAHWSITLTVILSAIATYWVAYGAMRGMLAHRVPRVVLAMGFLSVTIGFALLLILDYSSASTISRVGYWVLCIGASWSATTGIKAGERMKTDSSRLEHIEDVLSAMEKRDTEGDGE